MGLASYGTRPLTMVYVEVAVVGCALLLAALRAHAPPETASAPATCGDEPLHVPPH